MPPPLDMPSVAALRAFEVAARHESFSRAAEELHVTPAAIAQHVKAVEAWAQQSLFDRTARGVTLTDAGQRARPMLTDAFHALGTAANLLRDGAHGVKTLRIAAVPAIAELWLAPRLREIRELTPDADVSLHAVDRQPDLQRDGFDLIASFEPSDTDTDHLVLVAAPELGGQIDSFDDLADLTRLRDLAWDHHWTTWFAPDAAPATARTLDLSLFAMAVAAAKRGEGVLVGRHSLVADELARGALVEPFDRRIPTGDRLTIAMRNELVFSELAAWLESAVDDHPDDRGHAKPE